MWHEEGNCNGFWHLFSPAEGETPRQRDTREWLAKAMCVGCPITLTCLKLGLSAEVQPATDALFGVWGGMNRAQLIDYVNQERQRKAKELKGHTPERQLDGTYQCKCGHPLGRAGRGGRLYWQKQREHVRSLQ